MDSISRFIDTMKNKQILTQDFINNFIFEFLAINNLSINKLVYVTDEDFTAGYGSDQNIYLNYENIITNSMIYLGLKEEVNLNQLTSLNLSIIKLLYHELIHVQQHDKNFENKEIKEMLDKVFYYITKNPDIYKAYHDTMLTEYNANITSPILTDMFYDEVINEAMNIKNPYLYNEINLTYLRSYYGVSPLQSYNDLTNENLQEIKGLDTLDKLFYGMPLKEEEHQKVKKLGKIKEEGQNIINFLKYT